MVSFQHGNTTFSFTGENADEKMKKAKRILKIDVEKNLKLNQGVKNGKDIQVNKENAVMADKPRGVNR